MPSLRPAPRSLRVLVGLGVVTGALVLTSCSSGIGGATPAADGTTPSSVPATSALTTPPSPSPPASTTAPRSTRTIGIPTPPRSTPRSTSPYVPRTTTPTTTVPAGGRVVVLNPGHNGGNAAHSAQINEQVPAGFGEYKACDTTGTNTNAGYAEHSFNWDVSLRVRALLQARGVPVVLTRSSDTGVGPCVDERAAIGNRSDVAAVVSIHADGAPASGHGFHVNQDSRRPDGASAATAAASVRLGEALRASLASSSGLTPSNYIGTNGLYYRSDFAALNLARRPATFLELGNMRNAGDAARLSSSAGRQRIAAAVAAGILAFLGR